ncbi:hypothetical protein [Vibrio genomosp. F10]|uniref:hypothetical protein n=1 Tax=Vibrio genomosp. F10 TaxID=723171 RepID=UPI0002FD9027
MKDLAAAFGKQLRVIRKHKQISQDRLALIADIGVGEQQRLKLFCYAGLIAT